MLGPLKEICKRVLARAQYCIHDTFVLLLQVVLEPPSWAALFHRVGGIPRSVRHAIIMLPSPLHYPQVCTAGAEHST